MDCSGLKGRAHTLEVHLKRIGIMDKMLNFTAHLFKIKDPWDCHLTEHLQGATQAFTTSKEPDHRVKGRRKKTTQKTSLY